VKPIKLVCTDRGQHASRTLAKVVLDESGGVRTLAPPPMKARSQRGTGPIHRSTPPADFKQAVRRLDVDETGDSQAARFARRFGRRSVTAWRLECPSCPRDMRIDAVGMTRVDVSALR
jgi:hypothetical protein